MKVLIVGGGIAGLTLAAFLESSGIEYEIIEKAPDWSHQGYALGLWNNARNILSKLGLADAFDTHGTRIRMQYLRDGKGQLLRAYNFKDFYANYGVALSLVKRMDLHDWLFSKINASKVRMGTTVESLHQDRNGVTVGFTTGESKTYDLVVGADGMHSKIRELVFKEEVVSSHDWRIWFAWADNAFKTEASITEYMEPGALIVLFDSGDKTLMFLSAATSHVLWDDPKDRIERLKKSFKSEVALAPQIFDSLNAEDIVPSDLTHVCLRRWVNDRVVLAGDAAHGFEPNGGMGGSMALEDGYVLAGELMRVSDSYPLSTALASYERKRKKRVAIAARLTRRMKMFALVRSRFLRKIMNYITPFVPERFLVNDYSKLLKEEI